MCKSLYAATISECIFNRFAKDKPDIFNGMVGIHFKIAGSLAFEIEPSVASHGLEHVIKKRKSGCGLHRAGTIKIEYYGDAGLLCLA
jgi:hypothetical protein